MPGWLMWPTMVSTILFVFLVLMINMDYGMSALMCAGVFVFMSCAFTVHEALNENLRIQTENQSLRFEIHSLKRENKFQKELLESHRVD